MVVLYDAGVCCALFVFKMIKCRCSIGKFPKSCKENSNVHLEETAVEVEDVGCIDKNNTQIFFESDYL